MRFTVLAVRERCSTARSSSTPQNPVVSSEATLKWQTPSHLLWRWRSA